MAVTTLRVADTQSWIYPPLTYTGYDYVYKLKNHWYNGHSVLERRGRRCYQAGNSTSDGKYNGNMMSFMMFKDGSNRSMKQFISSIGGSGKITKILLRVTCGHAWYSSMNLKICVTNYANPAANWGQGGLTAAPHDSYDALGIRHLKTESINKGQRKAIDLTAYKSHFDSAENINFYVPGAYNKDYDSYGWLYGHLDSGGNAPELEIHYTTNSAPHIPGITINNANANGYITPDLRFTINSNGDPDNNLHSSPYAFQLYNESGNIFAEHSWYNTPTHTYNLEAYRGKTVRVRAIVRDTQGLMSSKDQNVYINSRPYWNGLNADATEIRIDSGVTNSIFDGNIGISWPKATDAQSAHIANLRYSIHCQKGSDSGAAGDTNSNLIANNLNQLSTTIPVSVNSSGVATIATTSGGTITINRGERIYFSIWVYDGLEKSSYRLTSQWLYLQSPPSKPTNVTPKDGHYETSVKVAWSASQGNNNASIKHYVVRLLDGNNTVKQTYTTTNTELTCNDLSLIARGGKFKFTVVAVDNSNSSSSESDPGESGLLTRNSAPTKPNNFKVNDSKLYFKNSIPLIWSASRDADGDAIKYNVYYSANNGAYQVLAKGISGNTVSHDITGFNPGVSFNYYVEAYDTFNVYSDKTYIANKPHVNIPPEAPEVLLPYADRTMYTNVPRIVFQTSNVNNDEKVKVIITINGKQYSSQDNSNLFDKSSYSAKQQGMFVVPSSAPLNYSKKNTVAIKVFDGMDDSPSKTYNYAVDASFLAKVGQDEERTIQALEINTLKDMINSNRFAYGLSQINWYDGSSARNALIYKKYCEQIIEASHGLVTNLNNKISSDNTKRVHSKDTVITGGFITKTVFNNVIEMILKP